MKIGVFDSGVGGLSVAQAIEQAVPDVEVVFRNDSEHIPYGLRAPGEIFGFIIPIFQSLIDEGCQVIVVACNTVTTTLIARVREHFADTPFVAIEPMVKPAAELTKSGIIAVCATPTTLASPRYAELKKMFTSDLTVLEPDCSDWTSMIERAAVDEQIISARINEVLSAGADVIVLGCTHYHWLEEDIKMLAGDKATVLQPETAIVGQLKRVLAQLD